LNPILLKIGVFEKPKNHLGQKKSIHGIIRTPKKANERAFFEKKKKKPKIHQSINILNVSEQKLNLSENI